MDSHRRPEPHEQLDDEFYASRVAGVSLLTGLRMAVMTVMALMAVAVSVRGATILSSLDLPGSAGPTSGGGSFVSGPSPRADVVPQPAPQYTAQQPAPSYQAPSAPSQRESAPAEVSNAGPSGGGGNVARTNEKAAPGNAGAAQAEGKQALPAAVVTTAPAWNFDLGWGWYDKYYFRGVDVLKSISPTHVHDGVVDARLNASYSGPGYGFSIGLGYIQALQKQIPNLDASLVPPNSKVLDNEKFSVPPEERYGEYDLYLAYTKTLIANQLEGTIGYNHYQFSNDGFWTKSAGKGINFADESTVRLDYIGLPWVRPSIMWAHDYDAFDGDYVELRLNGGFELYKQGTFSIRAEPYAAISYDFNYNGNNDGWNATEVGLDLPIHLNEFFTITPTVNYTKAMDPTVNTTTGKSTARADDGFWWGVTVDASWGVQASKPPPATNDEGKQIENLTAVGEDPLPWEISAEGVWEQFTYEFTGRSLPAFDVDPLYALPGKETSPGFNPATGGGIFLNGAVGAENGGPPGTGNGYSSFIKRSSDQIVGDRIYFATDRSFSASTIGGSTQVNADATDNIVSPDITLDRSVWQNGNLSFRAGFSYAYASSEGDSGQQLARIDSIDQTTSEKGTVYYLNNFLSPSYPSGLAVISNPADYINYVQTTSPSGIALSNIPGPTNVYSSFKDEVVKVATFEQTSVSQDANTIGVPLSIRYDLAPRLHLQLTVKPEITFLDSTMSTNLQARSLSDLNTSAGETAAALNAAGKPANILQQKGPFGVGNTTVPGPPVTVTTTTTAVAAGGGGKAGNNEFTPRQPGFLISQQTYTNSELDLLFGVESDLALLYDLDSEGRYFVQVSGGYHWASDLSLGGKAANANLKLSSLDVGLGFGIRF